MAELKAVRTESSKGSSGCAPALASGNASKRQSPVRAGKRLVFFKNMQPSSPLSDLQAGLNQATYLGHGHRGSGCVAAVLVLHQAFFEAAVAQGDAVRHTNELPVGKHGAWPLSPVVQNHVNPSSQQVGIELVSGGFDIGETVWADGAQDNRERR